MKLEVKLFDSKQIENSKIETKVQIGDNCPMCHKAGKPEYANGCLIRSFNEGEKPQAFIVWYCTNCKRYYVSLYHMNTGLQDMELDTLYPYPVEIDEQSLPQDIKEKYPDFIKVYSESCECEKQNLLTIAGAGYRKALEFLVKDYLQKEQHLTKEEVGDCRLEKCCKKIDFEIIRELANAATWLGNDETHYTVKHPEYDLKQMKAFLIALISSIHNKHELDKAKELLNS